MSYCFIIIIIIILTWFDLFDQIDCGTGESVFETLSYFYPCDRILFLYRLVFYVGILNKVKNYLHGSFQLISGWI